MLHDGYAFVNDLLYLTHRIPYPPNKGDKIRSFHLLRGLAERWNVHLGTFVDDDDDWQHVPVLEGICAETKFIGMNPTRAKVRALRGLKNATSLTMPYYQNEDLRQWVCDLAERRDLECVVAFSSPMAQYALPLMDLGIRGVVDFCDVDSDKWRQYSAKFGGIKRWVYEREANRLRDEETEIAERCDASVLISSDEVSVFCGQTGASPDKVHTVRNGVDVAYFDPELDFIDPYAGDSNIIVFVGAMDYWPNIDAVKWFTEEIFPAVRERNDKARFFIVGSNPSADVLKLDRLPGVTVTGKVDDVRPYLRFATCVAAPLRIARGVQNKVLEAMAMERPIVATTMAMEGITFDSSACIQICDTKKSWIDQLLSIPNGAVAGGNVLGARRHVSENFSWEASSRELAKIVTGVPPL